MPYKTPSNLRHYYLQHNPHPSAPPTSLLWREREATTPQCSAVLLSPKQPPSPSPSPSVFVDGRNCFKQVRLQEPEQATAAGEAEHSSSWNTGGLLGLGRAGQDFCQRTLTTIASATCRTPLPRSRTPTRQSRGVLTHQESCSAQPHPGSLSPELSHVFSLPRKIKANDQI